MPGSTKHPGALDSHTGGDPYGFAEAVDVWRTLLTADAPIGSTLLAVSTTTGLPSRGEVILADPDGIVTSEVVTYTGKTTTSLTGVSPTIRAWTTGQWVHTGPTARSHNDLAAAIVALEAKQGQSLAAPADTPVADRLFGSNASGKSGWIQLLIGMIPDGLVTAVKLATDSVTAIKIATNAVTTAKITDANVTAAKLAADAVTTVKILDANVTAAKLAVGAALTNIGSTIANANIAANAAIAFSKLDLSTTFITQAQVPGSQVISTDVMTAVQFNAETLDREGMHDNVTNNSRFTAVTSGWHLFLCQLSFDLSGTGYREGNFLRSDAVVFDGVKLQAIAGASTGIQFFALIQLTAGQYVQVQAYQSSTANRTINGGRCTVIRLG